MGKQTNVMSFAHLRNNTKSSWWKDSCLRMNVLHCAGLYFCVFYLGYDASLLNGLQALPQWTDYFNHPSSGRLGLISASLFLPAIVTPYISSIINTRWGRKPALAIGSVLIIAGALTNGLAKNTGTFIAGRVLLGAGGPFGKITAVALLQELAHPRLRPILASSFYGNYYLGSTAAAWFCFGSLRWGSTEWSWRAPCIFQISSPLIVLLLLLIIPESPRWLIYNGQKQKAMDILVKYHANGDVNDELVNHEFNEICLAIKLEEESQKCSYVDFIKTPANRRRLLVLLTMATGTNWIGNGIITYYLAPVLKLSGITDPTQVAGINGGIAVWNLLLAYLGAFNAERLGRRALWLSSTIGMLVTYVVMTGLSGSFANHPNHAVGIAIVPMLFIYYGFYDIGWTPLPFSYGAEILPYHMRLKGLSIMLSVQSVAQAFNQWVNPIALSNLAWKYYIIYIVLITIYLVLIFFFFPETRGLTIEEVSVVFDTGRLGDTSVAASQFYSHQAKHEDLRSSADAEKRDTVHIETSKNVV
ncbi:general substrate transporter [Xylogone sp. PMI_703]|nr:general substrate transporter [Xylogone sp. PMI_703]